ncbi:nuclear movement protein nudC, putative [Entamoeba invadens IP1]|uniref:Nuclear movement protein nudC, putative n=1 Tax=Entamoeba invadens IP1 TaxID=370355 RepID=A0A0A1TZG2_ENTIV|nr:nuclear movement protein nudC, putative [Entamoeba invadens IP1]ELP83920.1 nuclear movement protein nudC, putative [Entamoeba invadens IP1]|eukprot:XP_004183266.1 nuclear movement protein nudC, putative [Entamoeba invadens IP1]
MGDRWKPSPYVQYGYTEERYKWTQTPDDVTLTITLPDANLNTKTDLKVTIKSFTFELKIKDEVYIGGELEHGINVDESTWTRDGKTIEVIFAKGMKTHGEGEGCWWGCVIKGAHVIDIKRMESTKYLDDSLLKKLAEKDKDDEKEKEKKKNGDDEDEDEEEDE